jgi:molybdopterin adenylyltransferase
MSDQIKVVSVNISREKGTIKKPVDGIVLDSNGIFGDAHAGPWHRQVSLLSQECIDEFIARENRPTAAGEFAENITLQGLDFSKVSPLDRFRIGDTEIEVTQIGKKCHGAGCAIYTEVGTCIMPKEGLFAHVIKPGAIKAGDTAQYLPRTIRISIITLSDRASAGVYEDKSGPKVKELIDAHFAGTRWHLEIDQQILPDEQDQLEQKLNQAKSDNIDIVITTGSTGIAPRDIAPEAIAAVADKQSPA